MGKERTTSKEPKKNSKPEIPFWLQLVLILICGVVVSGVAFTITRSRLNLKREAQKPRYTVTFAYQDGTVIDTRQVKEGAGTYPPAFETDGVFQGWSAGFNEVMADIEVHPMVYEIIDDENLFCFNAVYVQEGDEFSVDLRLSGNVYISAAELQMEYDPEVMEFVEASGTGLCTVTKEEDGILLVKLDSDSLLTEGCNLSQIKFLAKKKAVYSTQIDLVCKSGTLSVDGKESPATVTTINNTIYYLQEVSQ